MRKNSRSNCAALLLVPALLLIYFGLRLYRDSLDTYTWTELLINYAAGFIRRGLIGRIGFLVSPYISVKFFLSALIILCYLLQLFLFYRISGTSIGFEWILFVLSPAAFLFPVYNFEAYGRKDVFLIVIFLITFLMVLKQVRLSLLLPLVLILYQFGVLIHEYALFYFPFALLIILLCYRSSVGRIYRWILPLCVIFIMGNLILLYALSKRYYNLDLIPASWEGLIPEFDLTPQDGAFGWMGVPLKEGLQPVFDKLSYPQTFFSYLIAFLLSLIPMILFDLRFRVTAAVGKRYGNSLRQRIIWAAALGFSAIVFIFSSDWGRLIYLYGFNLFPMLFVLKERLNLDEPEADIPESKIGYLKLAGVLFVILYAGSWFVKFYVDGGHIALQQGLLFRLLEWIAI